MNLGFCPIASSSKGNCYFIKSENTNLLLDAGISGKRIAEALVMLGTKLTEIDGLLVTHEHIDHVKSASKIMTDSGKCKLYCSNGTYEAIKEKINQKHQADEKVCIVKCQQTFMIGDIEVTSFSVSHDATEPLAYSFKKNGKKLSIVTDTGTVTAEIREAVKDSDVLVIESNHEVNILLYGHYPYHVKHRILSDEGHLSNETCGNCICDFLENQTDDKVPYVYLAHLSKENNTPNQAVLTIKNILEERGYYVGKDLKMEVIAPETLGNYLVI